MLKFQADCFLFYPICTAGMAKHVVKDSMKCVLDLYFVIWFGMILTFLTYGFVGPNNIPHTAALIQYVCYGRLAISK